MPIIIEFPHLKKAARSHKRKEALGVIISRLKALRAKGVTEINGLSVNFCSTYFGVREAGKPVLTGHFDDPGKIQIINGQMVVTPNEYLPDVHIMWWKRGEWEERLFWGTPSQFAA